MELTLHGTLRLAFGAVLVCGAILLPATAMAASATSGAPATVPRCAAASLLVWVGPAQGAAGSVAAEFGLTNHTANTCFLYGYPRVQMLDKSGKDLSTSDQEAPGAFSIQEKKVVLAPGKTAYFGVTYASQTRYAPLTCPTAATLKITPPQDIRTVTLHGPHAQIAPYGGTNGRLECGIVHVTAVTAKRFQ